MLKMEHHKRTYRLKSNMETTIISIIILAMPLVIGIIGIAIFGAKKKPKEDNKS